MQKNDFERYIQFALSTGADFVELYYEKKKDKNFHLIDSKLDDIDISTSMGLGIRIVKGQDSYYTSTNLLTEENICSLIEKILKNFPQEKGKKVFLTDLVDKRKFVSISHDDFPIIQKKNLLYQIDKEARSISDFVVQVSASLIEGDREFVIANSDSKYITSNSILTRLVISVYTEKDGCKEQAFIDCGKRIGYEFLDGIDVSQMVQKVVHDAIQKLDAKDFKGGELPVVIAPGFGAVIFHEACGHGLEATSVAPHLSVFSDDLGKKVATSKVTLIDDGTIPGAWGSFLIDDEGNPSEKNVLIENGILKKYLVDFANGKEMNMVSNGCGRRQNYHYATTSRMSNTYLAPGMDKIEDMIHSIDLGVYCERMSGGSVNPSTGDFNFAVDKARLIENGELKYLLKGITLIGNSKDILKNVEMVSDDLEISAGYCGSKSGLIPVTIGQPTIKVSKILVGGKE